MGHSHKTFPLPGVPRWLRACSCYRAMVAKLRLASRMPRANMFCEVLLAEWQYFKLIASCRLIFNICFIYQCTVFTRIRKVTVSWKGLYAICCRSFYVKPALFVELYLTLQTDFTARCCFCFFTNDSSIEQIFQPLPQRSFVSGIVKNVR